ncbi:MAG: fibrobacter succinogenes major paralogous domain-containing protein [Paludibacter sp.]|nr:fibrobacter succinogenes major paralogous domain-containing protein [Paludibacter sp.]
MRKLSFIFGVAIIATVIFSSCSKDDANPPLDNASVVINGVKWATRNVDAPGTFAAAPESAGMFYQWNRKIGWSATDPMINSNGDTVWDSSTSGDSWEKTNDPCPQGWRLPTLDELNKLLDTDKVKHEWVVQNGVYGEKFTDKNTGNTLFLPAAGTRASSNGTLDIVGIYGFYFSSTQFGNMDAYILAFYNNSALSTYGNRLSGRSIRAVAE